MGGLIRWPITRYAVALGLVAAAFLLTRALGNHIHPSGVPLFLVAVVATATLGGAGAGLLATFLSLAASVQLLRLESRLHDDHVVDLVWLASFLLVALSYSLLSRARARAEAELRDRDVRLRLVSEQIPAGLWSTDTDLRLTSRFGSGPHGADVINVFDALPRSVDGTAGDAEQYPPVAAHLRALAGESSSYEVAVNDRTFQCHVEPLRNADGAIIGVVGVALEISERKEAEDRLLEAKRVADRATMAKDQFLAMLSHELRTPLTPALAAASAMERRDDLPAGVREDVEMIRRNVELQARLIDDLLDLTRIAKGKMQLNVQTCDAHELVRSALAICRADVAGKPLEVMLDLSASEHVVRADAARLQQVFWNLIKNAVKFTPPGGRITVRSHNTASPGSAGSPGSPGSPGLQAGNQPAHARLVVEIIDTGMGIDADVLPRIFNTFEQGRESITLSFGGLGLGLAISKSLIDAHGGVIRADSPGRDRGATFAVELDTVPAARPAPTPAAPAPAIPTLAPPLDVDAEPVAAASATSAVEPPAAPAPVAAAATHHPKPLRILLVEDHRDTLRTMTRLLRGLGHTVETASTLDAALTVAERDAAANAANGSGTGCGFDLVISDIGLPDGSGLDLMRRLTGGGDGRHRRRRVKGIALSGYGMDADIRLSREAGFATHLTKPIDIDRLEKAIEMVGAMEEEEVGV